jgi:transaldolase
MVSVRSVGVSSLKIKIYADGAHEEQMLSQYQSGRVHGFTTNPSLMAKAGVLDYEVFARKLLSCIDLPISFEVLADDPDTIERQALRIAGWGSSAVVKIPITNTQGVSLLPVCRRLLDQGLKLNITALFTLNQLKNVHAILQPQDDAIISIFAGRIADTGIDPLPLMRQAVKLYELLPKAQVLWASCREAFNIYQAEASGCHIITATQDQMSKLALFGKSLEAYSLETIEDFYRDAKRSGWTL